MLQIAFIRENQEKVIKALAKRNMDAKVTVDEVVQLDEKRRATQVELDSIIKGNFHAFVQDNNGNYLAVGLTRGVEVTGGSITTGTALGDLNGYTLTINGKEALMAPFVASAVITAHASPTQITP